jgi:DNA-binding transcriptional MerR regulator
MAERTHLSIGEVLSLLREEFPDVTISKIRFLESQGLVDPERTPSGYRKFYDHDVERLRWILRQQRENFLPLKIIRGRLTEQGDELDDGDLAAEHDGTVALTERTDADIDAGARGREATIEAASSAHPAAANRPRSPVADPKGGLAGAPIEAGAAVASAGAPGPGSAPAEGGDSSPAGRSDPGASPGSGSGAGARPSGPAPAGGGQNADAGLRAGGRGRPGAGPQPALGEEAETFSAEELAEACGGTVAIVTDLQQYGLITARVVVGGIPYFDASALEVAKAATGFSRHGVEARHLRAWRNAADREAGIFEQVIVPLLRQRNPEARRQAAATLAELATLGGDLRRALVDQALRQIR